MDEDSVLALRLGYVGILAASAVPWVLGERLLGGMRYVLLALLVVALGVCVLILCGWLGWAWLLSIPVAVGTPFVLNLQGQALRWWPPWGSGLRGIMPVVLMAAPVPLSTGLLMQGAAQEAGED
jgi:hypothetical protein